MTLEPNSAQWQAARQAVIPAPSGLLNIAPHPESAVLIPRPKTRAKLVAARKLSAETLRAFALVVLSPTTPAEEKDALRIAAVEAQKAQRQVEDEIRAEIDADADEIRAEADELVRNTALDVLGQLDAVEDGLASIDAAQAARAAVSDNNSHKRFRPAPSFFRTPKAVADLRVRLETVAGMRDAEVLSPSEYRSRKSEGTLPKRFRIRHGQSAYGRPA